jgi:galactokinase
VRVVDAATGEAVALDVRHSPGAILEGGALPWHTYPAAVLRRVARNFPHASRGADIAFASNLPAASGLSSSSALVVAIALGLLWVNELEADDAYRANIRTREDLAGYLATMENGAAFGTLGGETGVGTFGGSQDHVAILCCQGGMLSQYAFSPARFETAVALQRSLTFVVCASGVVAEKTGGARQAYNRASLSAQTVLAIWNRASGRTDATLAAACGTSDAATAGMHAAIDAAPAGRFPPALLHERLDQFVDESLHIVPAATAALRAGDLGGFGALVDRSQAGAERGLHNQVEETTTLVRIARDEGVVAASAFGAGFGGSVWALVEAVSAPAFASRWRRAYLVRFPGRVPELFSTGAGPSVISLTEAAA